jgi:hypothetical protein
MFISPLNVAGVLGGISSEATFIAETPRSLETTPKDSRMYISEETVTRVSAGTAF